MRKKPHEQARQERGEEQFADGLVGDDAIEDHQDARRDEHAERAARGDDGGGERGGVLALEHGWDHDPAHGRGGGGAGAGNGGEEHGSQHAHHAEPAAHVADDGLGDADQPARDAARLHDGPGEEEHGHSDQRERVHRIVKGLGEADERVAGVGIGRGGGYGEREAERDADQDQQAEPAEQNPCNSRSVGH